MKNYIISKSEDSIQLTVKNKYSIQYNLNTSDLSFISNNINLSTKINHTSKRFTSIIFGYYDLPYIKDSSLTDEFNIYSIKSSITKTIVLCKDPKNTYNIRSGSGKYKDYLFVTMPSKVFKHLRYTFYDTERRELLLYRNAVHFRCLKQHFTLRLRMDKLLLDVYEIEKSGSKCNIGTYSIDSYVVKPNYLYLSSGKHIFHLSPHFQKSFRIVDQHFGFLRDVRSEIDIWEYFFKNPYTKEEWERAYKIFRKEYEF